MPKVAGRPTLHSTRDVHSSHAFLGPHRAWYQNDKQLLASAFSLEGALDEAKLSVSLKNLTGHSLPTGFPGRMMMIDCDGFDGKGAKVWSCQQTKLHKVYVDAEGKRTLAPYGVRISEDTRLKPNEDRSFDFAPGKSVVSVSVRISMRLLPPGLAKKIDLVKAPEGSPVVIREQKFERTRSE